MKYNISDVIDFNVIHIFQQFSLITFIITVIVEIFYGIIVYLTTSKQMNFFRFLTFLYIFECIFAEFIMFCWKPFRLFPFTILYPTGILAPMSSTASALMAAFFVYLHVCFVETLTTIVVERHLRILGNAKKNKARFWVYSFMLISNAAFTIPLFMFFLLNLDDAESQEILRSEIENFEQILDLQPSLYYLKFSSIAMAFIVLLTAAIYAICRCVIFIYILKENYNFVQKATNPNISIKTRKQFMLMFHSTLVQFCTTLFFAAFALIFVITFFIPENNASIKFAYYISLGTTICYPIADVIIVITVVKGYRNTVKKMFNIVFAKNGRKVSEFAFHTILNNNNNNNNQSNIIAARRASKFI